MESRVRKEWCKKTMTDLEKRIEKAAKEYCKEWPWGTYHTNDLTLFYEVGAKEFHTIGLVEGEQSMVRKIAQYFKDEASKNKSSVDRVLCYAMAKCIEEKFGILPKDSEVKSER